MNNNKYETEDFIALHKALEKLLDSMIDAQHYQGKASFDLDGVTANIEITLNSLKGDK